MKRGADLAPRCVWTGGQGLCDLCAGFHPGPQDIWAKVKADQGRICSQSQMVATEARVATSTAEAATRFAVP